MNALRFEFRCKRSGEQDISRLALSIAGPHVVVGTILEIVVILPPGTYAVTVAGQIDNAGACSCRQKLGKDERSEEKMSEMVCGELHLDSIFVLLKIGKRHDASVVDENIKLGDGVVDLRCRRTDRIEVGEINWHKCSFDGRVEGGDLVLHRSDLILGAGCQYQMRWVGMSKRDGCLCSQTGFTGTSDENFVILVTSSLNSSCGNVLVLPSASFLKWLTTSMPLVSREKVVMLKQYESLIELLKLNRDEN